MSTRLCSLLLQARALLEASDYPHGFHPKAQTRPWLTTAHHTQPHELIATLKEFAQWLKKGNDPSIKPGEGRYLLALAKALEVGNRTEAERLVRSLPQKLHSFLPGDVWRVVQSIGERLEDHERCPDGHHWNDQEKKCITLDFHPKLRKRISDANRAEKKTAALLDPGAPPTTHAELYKAHQAAYHAHQNAAGDAGSAGFSDLRKHHAAQSAEHYRQAVHHKFQR